MSPGAGSFRENILIKRIVGRSSNESVKERCYFASVRPHLEYATSIWDPEQKDLIKKLEKIQEKAARFAKSCYGKTESVLKLLEELKWEPLRTWRLRAGHSLLKTLRTETFRGDTENIIPMPHYIFRSERGDKIRKILCRTYAFKYFQSDTSRIITFFYAI
jgi:hypothetical protein